MDDYYHIAVFRDSPDGTFLSEENMPLSVAEDWEAIGDHSQAERWILSQWRKLIGVQRDCGAQKLAFRITRLANFSEMLNDYGIQEESWFIISLDTRTPTHQWTTL